jgi:hypothetical protein
MLLFRCQGDGRQLIDRSIYCSSSRYALNRITVRNKFWPKSDNSAQCSRGRKTVPETIDAAAWLVVGNERGRVLSGLMG